MVRIKHVDKANYSRTHILPQITARPIPGYQFRPCQDEVLLPSDDSYSTTIARKIAKHTMHVTQGNNFANSSNSSSSLVNTRYELVLHDCAVALPVLPVLDRTAFEVAAAAVDKHYDEKDGVEVRDG